MVIVCGTFSAPFETSVVEIEWEKGKLSGENIFYLTLTNSGKTHYMLTFLDAESAQNAFNEIVEAYRRGEKVYVYK